MRKQEAWEKYRPGKTAARCDSAATAKHFWAYVQSKTTAKEAVTKLKTVALSPKMTGKLRRKLKENSIVSVKEDMSHPSPVPDSVFKEPKTKNLEISRGEVKRRLEELNISKA